MLTRIIGLGNPYLGDDGIGPKAASELAEKLAHRRDIEVVELGLGGLRLMETLEGADRAFILDAMVTGEHPPGTISVWPIEKLPVTKNLACLHDAHLGTALDFGRTLGMHLPREIIVYGVEATSTDIFTETLTPAVAAALPQLLQRVLNDLDEPQGRPRAHAPNIAVLA